MTKNTLHSQLQRPSSRHFLGHYLGHFLGMTLLGLALVLPNSSQAGEAGSEARAILNACTPDEELNLPGSPEEALDGIRTVIRDKNNAIENLEKASFFRAKARTPEAQALADYWIAQSWKAAGSPHTAFDGFASIVSRPIQSASAPIQWAALECVNRVREGIPSLQAPSAVISALPAFSRVASTPRLKAILEEAAFHAVALSQSDESAKLLRGEAQAFARAMIASRKKDHRRVVALLGPALAASQLPSYLERHRDEMRILLARSQYALGQYDQAAESDLKLRKSSNLAPEMLSELAWAHLSSGKYKDAVGVALELQKGALRSTFAPESPLILGMAMNELCQYSEALHAVQKLQTDYRSSQLWLANWEKNGSAQPLYDQALAFAARQDAAVRVPARVVNEWISSPVFIADQSEIHGLFEEEKSLSAMEADATPRLRPALAQAKAALGARRKVLATLIESDLAARNRRMLAKLAETGRQMRLVRIEVLGSAGQDMVWRNAHPEFEKFSKMSPDEAKRNAPAWDWGRSSESDDGRMEVWEDEVGSFQARLMNQCSKKDQFLSNQNRR